MDRAQRRRDDRRAKAKARAKISRNERYLLGSGDWEVSAFPEDYGAPERMTFAPLEMSPEGGLRLIATIVGLEGRA